MRLGRTADATIYGRHIAAAATALVAVLLLLAPSAAAVGPAPGVASLRTAFVPQELLDAAAANPDQIFRVIVQGQPATPVSTVQAGVQQTMSSAPSTGDAVNGAFSSISAVAAELTGEQIGLLSGQEGVFAITPDMPLRASVADPPVALEPPVLTGAAETGATLSASPGQWAGSQLAYAYQWQRCDAASACADIAGAASSTYDVTSDDTGSTLLVVVSATNADGSASSTSAATAAVVSPPPALQIVPPSALTVPAVTGVATAGETLSADDGSWSGIVSLARQWQRCSADGSTCLDVAGATDPTYLLGSDDVGFTMRVVATATDIGGSASAASAVTATVESAPAPPPPPPPPPPPADPPPPVVPPAALVPPAVSGSAVDGQTLGADDGVWSGTAVELARQWQRCSSVGDGCLDVAGAVDPTYLVGPDDVGFTLRVVVTGTDAFGSSSTPSTVTDVAAGRAAPAAPVPPSSLAAPAVTGTTTAGKTLTAEDGTWTGIVQLTRQWQRCLPDGSTCNDIGGAVQPTYLLGSADVGSTIRVVVTANDGSMSAAASSNATGVVAAQPASGGSGGSSGGGGSGGGPGPSGGGGSGGGSGSGGAADPPPVNATLPTTDSSPTARSTVLASPGTWTTHNGPLHYTYRWERCNEGGLSCVPVGSVQDYTPTDADAGSTLHVVVTATDDDNLATSATSALTDRVAPYSPSGFWSWQLGPYAAKVDAQWNAVAAAHAKPPAIAVVDSGVDSTLPGLDGTVVQQVSLTSLPQGTAADGYGHGSFVAQVAAGHAKGAAGAAPKAPIVSLDVMNDDGMALTSDVVAAADWIYTHKDENNVRVANFSLIGSAPSSIIFDPLDRALERLWLSGVVVVTAAGNYAVDGQRSDVPFAPANDPFAITVGASDTAGTLPTSDDVAAPWSAYGHTIDGFAKPELGAPGRYVVASVPPASTLYTMRPDRIVAPGKLQLSGTSFAAPFVSGVAADLLALHPDWTPDQVKGALMLSAAQPGPAAGFALGVGEVDGAAALSVTDPPNPNAALEQFVVPDPNGGDTPTFDAASWGTTAQADASWGTASWGTASWGTASWGTASWGTGYWSSASWGTASWGTASWGTASWGTASWGTASWGTDYANADVLPGPGYAMRWTP